MIILIIFLILIILLIVAVIIFLKRTPAGLASICTKLLVKVMGLKVKKSKTYFNVAVRRVFMGKAVLFLDGKPKLNDGVQTQNSEMNVPDRVIAVRRYDPPCLEPLAIVLFFHGGGFMLGNIETHERLVRDICRRSRSVVISVAYRLAPEHQFPSAHEDALASYQHILSDINEGALPPLPVFVAGDSAGGNLAASLCLMSRSEGITLPTGQILLYPSVNISCTDSDSYRLFGSGYLLGRAEIEWFRDCYIPNKADLRDPRACPLLAENHSQLPPALVITAEMDILRDEGEAYAQCLRDALVYVEQWRFPGVMHGFAQMRHFTGATRKTIGLIADFIKSQTEKLT